MMQTKELTASSAVITSSKPGHFLTSRRKIVLILAMCILTISGLNIRIATLQKRAQQARDAQITIEKIRVEATLTAQHEMEAMAGDNSAPEAPSNVRQSENRVTQLVLQLNSLIGEEKTKDFYQTVDVYQDTVLDAIKAFNRGNAVEGNRIDSEKIDPLEVKVEQDVNSLDTQFSNEADQASRQAMQGTVLALLIGSAVVGLFLIILSKVMKASAALTASQESILCDERRWSSMIQNVSDVIAIVDEKDSFLFVSPAAEKLLGFQTSELLGFPILDLLHPEDSLLARLALDHIKLSDESVTQEWRLQDASGGLHYCEIVLTNLTDNPYVCGTLVTCRDITERKGFEDQLSRQAFYDSLTGLPNRALLHERLQSALARSERSGNMVGLLFLDLDNFKVVNDSLGHDEGDRLLIQLGKRFTACVRPYDTVARLGGDEFTILLEDLEGREDLERIADEIQYALKVPISLSDREVVATASIGIATSEEGASAECLLRNADTAMYCAKTGGKAGYAIFTTDMSVQAMERLDLEADLRLAVESNQLTVHYQAILSLESNRPNGMEALLRWDHPIRGSVSPVVFIPIAEATGLILALGDWVMQTACRTTAEWIDSEIVPSTFRISVNVSARQVLEPDFVEKVIATLADTGLKPENLKIEITESVLMKSMEDCIIKMRNLQALGVKIAIDDFGTGYSSMSYLSSMPIDTLKIDRSFVSRIGNPHDCSIIKAIISMASAMGLEVTGEGIETPEQLQQLGSLGCGDGQGYLFAKPLTADAARSLLCSNAMREIPAKAA